MSERQAFDLIFQKLLEVLEPDGYASGENESVDGGGFARTLVKEDHAYKLVYLRNKKMFELRDAKCAGDAFGEWRTVSIWVFDPSYDKASDAESIALEFTETIRGPKKAIKTFESGERRKAKKGDENVSDPIFFLNRMANIFPELKAEMTQEKITYGSIRVFTFTREKVVPQISSLAEKYAESDLAKKLVDVLSDMYSSGDLDVRAMITNVILNSLDDTAYEKLVSLMSDELKLAAKSQRKYKGVEVKPEKKKKKGKNDENLLRMNLDDMERQMEK